MTAQPHQLEAVPPEFRHLVPDHGKSPWHPSVKATKRVLNVLPAPTEHECGTPVEIAHHNQVYGREYSDWPWMYRCAKCDASPTFRWARWPTGICATCASPASSRSNCCGPASA